LKNAELVAVTDFNPVTARGFAETHGIPSVRATLDELLDSAEIDVLHVITPPAYHYECAKAALDHGIHVFVEKPVAFTVREVTDLYDRASAHGVLLCPDYIQLFHPKMQELVGLVDSGQLGNVVHVETYLCVNLEDSPEVLEAEGIHWSYRLPGGMLRDFTSHLLYMSFYFAGLPNDIQVSRNSRGALPQGLIDHLTVQIDGIKSTATVLLSCVPRPSAYGIRVRCEKGSAELNFETQTLVVDRQSALPRRIVAATANFAQSWKLSRQGVGNILDYVRGKLVPYGGMRVLIPHFYDSILQAKEAPPIARDLATAVTLAEEQIFSGSPNPQFRGCHFPSAQTGIRKAERVLVTGANGFVGLQVIKALLKEGYFVRAMIRPTSSADRLKQLQVEVFLGDVRRLDDVLEAADGMQVVIHLAAGMKGSPEFIVDTCVRGTKNVAEAALSRGVKRVIYMSSFSVYDLAKLRDGDDITETSPLEEQPENRGAYSVGKRRAEDVALSHLSSATTPWTILRPPVIVGHRHDIFSPVGSKVGNTLVCLGSPRKRLPLVHVEDVAAAVPQLLQNKKTEGQVYILSHPHTITVRDYVESGIRQNGYQDLRAIYVPYFVARLGGLMAAVLKKLTKLGPTINRRRLLSFYRDVGVNSTLLQEHAGWHSAVELPEGLSREADGRNTAEQVSVNQHVPVG
jgi:predicted dehydrogenase